MRILFDARAVDGRADGMSTYVRHLLLHLLAADSVNDYLALLHPVFHEELARSGWLTRPNLHPVVATIPFMDPTQQLRIPWLLRTLPPCSVYHYPHFDMPLGAHPASVVTIYDLNQFAFAGYFDSGRLVKRGYSYLATMGSLAKARQVIVISSATKAHVLKRFPWVDARKVTVVYFGLNEAFNAPPSPERLVAFRRRMGLGERRFILYVGTHRPHKNLDRVLRAYAHLRRQRGIPHRFLLVGSSAGRSRVPDLIRQLGLEEDVVWLPRLPDEELPLAYRAAEAFVFCSLSEGFGLPLLEAMASEVPVVTSNLGAPAEIAGEAGLLVDPRSVEAIADGIWRVLSSDALRRDLIARGRRRAAAFRWERCATQTLEVYARAAGVRETGAQASSVVGRLRDHGAPQEFMADAPLSG